MENDAKSSNEERNCRRRELRIEKKKAELCRTCVDMIVASLGEKGYVVSKLHRASGYFIFDYGRNTVNTLWFKELPEWRFGIWCMCVDEDDGHSYLNVEFFAQPEKDVDKFKPSRSIFIKTFRFPYDKKYKLNDGFKRLVFDNHAVFEITKMMDFIKSHPYRAWAISEYGLNSIYDVPWSGFRCWRKYVVHKYRRDLGKKYADWANERLMKFMKRKVLWVIEDWDVKEYTCISPKYQIFAPLEKNKFLFPSKGHYGLFCSEDECREILETQNIDEKYKKFARRSMKLEKKLKRLEDRCYRLSRWLHVYYFGSDVTDDVLIVERNVYEKFKNSDL